MPPKKKRAPPKKRKYTQKQKQKQKQSVNVKVSTGGGGGGTSFIPIPQAPAIDYAMLSQYLRPPNTVDAPIAAKSPEISAARTKIAERLAMRKPEDLMPQVRASEQASMGPLQGGMSSSSSRGKSVAFVGASSAPSESESEVVAANVRRKGRPSGSKNKPKPVATAYVEPSMFSSSTEQGVPNYFESDIPSEPESRRYAQAAFERLKEKKAREMTGMGFL